MDHNGPGSENAKKPCDDEILNGAQCEHYSWTQTISDLEIRVNIPNHSSNDAFSSISNSNKRSDSHDPNESVKLHITSKDISLEWNSIIILRGRFERQVDKQSACWTIERQAHSTNGTSINWLVLYLDKLDHLWWSEFLREEKQSLVGSKFRVMSMADLNQESRMTVYKLIYPLHKLHRSVQGQSQSDS